MFRWLIRAYLVIAIINIIDSVVCILLSNVMLTIHIYPTLQESVLILLNAPWIISEQYSRINMQFIRAIMLIVMMIIIIVYMAGSAKEAALYYFAIILVAFLSYVTWTIISGISLSTVLQNFMGASQVINPSELLRIVLLIVIYHLPFATLTAILYQVVNKYKMIVSEIEAMQKV